MGHRPVIQASFPVGLVCLQMGPGDVDDCKVFQGFAQDAHSLEETAAGSYVEGAAPVDPIVLQFQYPSGSLPSLALWFPPLDAGAIRKSLELYPMLVVAVGLGYSLPAGISAIGYIPRGVNISTGADFRTLAPKLCWVRPAKVDTW